MSSLWVSFVDRMVSLYLESKNNAAALTIGSDEFFGFVMLSVGLLKEDAMISELFVSLRLEEKTLV